MSTPTSPGRVEDLTAQIERALKATVRRRAGVPPLLRADPLGVVDRGTLYVVDLPGQRLVMMAHPQDMDRIRACRLYHPMWEEGDR